MKVIKHWVPFVLFALALLWFASVANTAFASGDELTNKSKNVLTGGDNIANNSSHTSGSRAYSLPGHDVDINDCLYSWGAIVQGVKLNRWCAAERMDALGLHDGAAMMRCTIKPILKLYTSEAACFSSQTVKTFHMEPPEPSKAEDSDEDDRVDILQARLDAFEAKAADDAKRPPKVVQRTVIEQKPLFTDEKLAALRAIKEEK